MFLDTGGSFTRQMSATFLPTKKHLPPGCHVFFINVIQSIRHCCRILITLGFDAVVIPIEKHAFLQSIIEWCLFKNALTHAFVENVPDT